MSLNHFSSSELQETQWWDNTLTSQQNQQHPPFTMDTTFHHQLYQNYPPGWLGSQISQQPPTLNFNLNQQHNESADGELHQPELQIDMEDDKETMFEKPLTPSDVGKLNRLVIPKQHAEKYFPLGRGGGESGGEKGPLLSFEDESGKCWRFRYSYWNSSQSYVLTKGWSRYVKEKRLDAGDVVCFERRRNDSDRLFIGWRRRAAQESSSAGGGGASNNTSAHVSGSSGGGGESGSGRGGNWNRVFYSAPQSYPAHHHQSVPYPPDYLQHAAAAAAGSSVQNQTPSSSSGGGNSRILRLFGVNLECQQHQGDESEPSTPDGSSLSSQGLTHPQFYPNPTNAYYGDHRDFTFSRDAMKNRRG